jgi:hypothetical protein
MSRSACRWCARLTTIVVAFVVSSLALAVSPAAATVDGSDVVAVGAAPDQGSLLRLGVRPTQPVLGLAADATGSGYWMVAGDGGIFAFGAAPFYGSTGGTTLNRPVVGMAATADGGGYWMFAGDGGIFAFGNAAFYGSLGSTPLNAPIVAMSPTSTGRGYWMVGADGGVFAFGDAAFAGSTGGQNPSSPIIAMAPLRSGSGYWIVTAGGQVLAFGQAVSYGDLSTKKLSNPVVGIAVSPTGKGYWLAQADGQVWAFGDASPALAAAPRCAVQGVVAVAARPQGDGLWMATAPFPAVSSEGLAPLAALDAESADIAARLAVRQGCQTLAKPADIAWSDPLVGGKVSSAFGERIHPVFKVPQFHRGLDLASAVDVRAAAAGTVLEVTTRTGYGRTIVIDHGGRIATLYGHLASANVKAGDTVTTGQKVGVVGKTGFATGPHLHVEIRVSGDVIDPTPILRP